MIPAVAAIEVTQVINIDTLVTGMVAAAPAHRNQVILYLFRCCLHTWPSTNKGLKLTDMTFIVPIMLHVSVLLFSMRFFF